MGPQNMIIIVKYGHWKFWLRAAALVLFTAMFDPANHFRQFVINYRISDVVSDLCPGTHSLNIRRLFLLLHQLSSIAMT
jgi:hypothetical protein